MSDFWRRYYNVGHYVKAPATIFVGKIVIH